MMRGKSRTDGGATVREAQLSDSSTVKRRMIRRETETRDCRMPRKIRGKDSVLAADGLYMVFGDVLAAGAKLRSPRPACGPVRSSRRCRA